MRLRHLSIVCACAALLATACSSFSVAAATVDGRRISEAQVEDELDNVRQDPTFKDLVRRQGDEVRGVLRRNILTGLIRQSIIEQEARRRNVRVGRAQADALIRREASRLGLTVAEFLEQQNLSVDDARTLALRQLRDVELRRAVTGDLRVSPDEVRRAYDSARQAFEEVHLLRITVRSADAAQTVRAALRDGELFSTVAREHSVDDLADEGGDMGFVQTADLDGTVQAAIQALEADGVTSPLQVQGGFQVYKLLTKRTKPLAEVAGQIEDQILQEQRAAAFDRWLSQRLGRARVVVNPKYGRFDRSALQVVAVPRQLPA